MLLGPTIIISSLSFTLPTEPQGKVTRLDGNLISMDENVTLLKYLHAKIYLETAISSLAQEDETSCKQSLRLAFNLNPTKEVKKVLLDYFKHGNKRGDFEALNYAVLEEENMDQVLFKEIVWSI